MLSRVTVVTFGVICRDTWIVQRGGAVLGDHTDHVALRKDAEYAHRGVGDDHCADPLRGEQFDDFLESAMRLGREDLAPLFAENARNCHSVSP